MTMRRLSVDSACKDGFTCPAVWVDDDVPDQLVIVGVPVELGPHAVGPGEIAIRVKRQVIADAGIGAVEQGR